MNWVVVGLVANMAVTLLAAGIVYGRLTQRVEDSQADIADLKDDKERLWKVTNYNTERIAYMRGQIEGKSKGNHA